MKGRKKQRQSNPIRRHPNGDSHHYVLLTNGETEEVKIRVTSCIDIVIRTEETGSVTLDGGQDACVVDIDVRRPLGERQNACYLWFADETLDIKNYQEILTPQQNTIKLVPFRKENTNRKIIKEGDL